MKYSFIAQHKKTWPIDLMCKVLGVTRNGYYSFQKRQMNKPDDPLHEEMLEWVKEIAKASDDAYGSRRMEKAMNGLGYPIGRFKARQLMKEAGVQVRHKKKYKVTTDSDHNLPVFGNLLKRQFTVEQPDQAYVSDISYIWTQRWEATD